MYAGYDPNIRSIYVEYDQHIYILQFDNNVMVLVTRKAEVPRDDEILRVLYQQNPWWEGKPIPEIKLKEFKRRDFFKLTQNLDNPKILGIIGARQVGKTTMLYQLIEKLKEEIDPRRIFFLSLSDHYLYTNPENMTRIFDLYSTNIIKKPLDELENTVYLIFDEIQELKNWQDILNRWVNLGYKIKFIISGSSSTDIFGGTSESLVGRINIQIVLPMKFLEYVRFNERNQLETLIHTVNMQMRKGLKDSVESQDPEMFYDSVTNAASQLASVKDKLVTYLNQYIIQGGYPEVATIDNQLKKAEVLRDYLHLTLYKDIIRTGKVRDPISLENLFAVLAKESSQIINKQKISKNLGIDRDTLNTYLYLLKETFLISDAEMYSSSRVVRGKNEKKIYVNDIGIRNVIAATFDERILLNYTEVGKMAETVVADHTKRLKFNLDPSSKPFLFYWRKSHEVDLVIELFQKPLPIEVKYRQNIDEGDIKGLKNFNEKFRTKFSIVVSKDLLDRKDSIVFVPAWLYLIMC